MNISLLKKYIIKKRIIIISVLILFFLLENLLFLYNKTNTTHPILGQKLENTNLSTYSKQQVLHIMEENFASIKPLVLSYAGNNFVVKQIDVGAKVNYQKTLRQLYSVGRNGNFFQNITDQNKAILGLSSVHQVVSLSKPLLVLKVLTIADQINKGPTPSMPDFSKDWQHILPQTDGIKVDSAKLSEIITKNIFSPPTNPISIPVEKLVKKYPAYDFEAIRRQAEDYTDEQLSITSGGFMFTLSPQDLKSLLTVAEQSNPKDPKKTIMVLTIDSTKLHRRMYQFAEKVEAATNAEFNYHDAQAAIYGQFYTNTRRLIDAPTGPSRGYARKVLGQSTNTTEKVVYLTFDDGPNIVYHPMILDILKEKGVKATFYLVGSNTKLYAPTTKRTIQEGHVVGNHSLTHAYLAKLLPNQIYDEIKTTRDILDSLLSPGRITLFRPPYGGTNALVEKYAVSFGLKEMLWTVDPKDWSEPTTSELINRVVQKVQNGSVVLLHSNHFSTVKALPSIIDILRENGYQFKVQE